MVPLALSDSQFQAVCQACEPLLPIDRSQFLQALAAVLRDAPQPLGDGSVHRAIRALQRELWRPPAVVTESKQGRRVVGDPIA
jgi:hypothetical protein